MTPLILASASAARAKLLRAAGLQFKIVAAEDDEEVLKQDSAVSSCGYQTHGTQFAVEKATLVARAHPVTIVLGADQILSLDGEIVSKCSNDDEAATLLRRLRGRTHELVTAAVLAGDGVELWSHVSTSRMAMRAFSDVFLQDYLASAGAALGLAASVAMNWKDWACSFSSALTAMSSRCWDYR